MKAIRIDHVSKNNPGTKALQDVSLTFEFGKIYGMLGRNGAGKSTLLSIISNRIFASEGHVWVDDQLAVENDHAQKLIYMMSEQTLYPKDLKVKKVFYWTKEFYQSFDLEKAMRLSAMFQLNVDQKIKALSTGYKSIFKLIIALCVDVPYVFLDEPVLGLDANHRELFYKLLMDAYTEEPRTYIIATHLIEEIAHLIEDIVIIKDGKVMMNTSVEELIGRGYSVSGKAQEVDAYCAGKHTIGEDMLGGLKTAYILGKKEAAFGTLEFSGLNLQKLFIELTRKENEA